MLISPNVNPFKLSSCAQLLRQVTQPSRLPLTRLSPGHSAELNFSCHLGEETVPAVEGEQKKKMLMVGEEMVFIR